MVLVIASPAKPVLAQGIAPDAGVPPSAPDSSFPVLDAGVAPFIAEPAPQSPSPTPSTPSLTPPSTPVLPTPETTEPASATPTTEPEVELETEPSSTPAAASPDAEPEPAEPAEPSVPASKKQDTRGILIGADLGIGSGGGGSDLFGAGLGSSLSFGYRSGTYTLIFRLAESYDLSPDSALQEALDGSFKPSSVVFSYWLSLHDDWRLGLGGGPALVSSSYVTSENGVVGVAEREAVGAALMLAASLPLGSAVNFVVSMHGYALFWEHPAEVVIEDVADEMVVRTVDPNNGMPLSLSAGFHFQF